MVRRFSLDGGKLALALILAILVYQVVIPLLMVVWTSLKVERPGQPGSGGRVSNAWGPASKFGITAGNCG